MGRFLFGLLVVPALWVLLPAGSFAAPLSPHPSLPATWGHSPAQLGDAIRLHDPENPLLQGYRSLAAHYRLQGLSLSDLTYWFYDGQLARIRVVLAEDPAETQSQHRPGGPWAEGFPSLLEAFSPLLEEGSLRGAGREWFVERGDLLEEAEAARDALSPGELYHLLLEDLRREAVEIPYRELLRHGELHEGRALRYTGRVLQVLGEGAWRVSVRAYGTIGAGNVLYARYLGPDPPQVAVDDALQLLGIAAGQVTYTSLIGTQVTIPRVYVYRATRLEPPTP